MSGIGEDVQLSILEQKSVTIEDGVHVVVKNSPFIIKVGFTQNMFSVPIDLNYYHFETKLIYDRPGPEKEVSYVNTVPVESHIKPTEGGDCVVLSCKISVLTSQHEDTNFFVKISALSKETNKLISSVFSNPIKVLSKTIPSTRSRPKQRITPKALLECAQQIEKTQMEYFNNLIGQVNSLKNSSNTTTSTATQVLPIKRERDSSSGMSTSTDFKNLWSVDNSSSSHSTFSLATPTQQPIPAPALNALATSACYTNEENFLNSFGRFMSCYKTLTQDEKLNLLGKLRTQFSEHDRRLLESFLEEIKIYTREHTCNCTPCPYEKQAFEELFF